MHSFWVIKQVVYIVTTALKGSHLRITKILKIPLHYVGERDRTWQMNGSSFHTLRAENPGQVNRPVFFYVAYWSPVLSRPCSEGSKHVSMKASVFRSTDLISICGVSTRVTAPVSALARNVAKLTCSCSAPTPGGKGADSSLECDNSTDRAGIPSRLFSGNLFFQIPRKISREIGNTGKSIT
jgi:hypothetical protein